MERQLGAVRSSVADGEEYTAAAMFNLPKATDRRSRHWGALRRSPARSARRVAGPSRPGPRAAVRRRARPPRAAAHRRRAVAGTTRTSRRGADNARRSRPASTTVVDERQDPLEQAAEHDEARVEDVDQPGQADRQPAAGLLERRERRPGSPLARREHSVDLGPTAVRRAAGAAQQARRRRPRSPSSRPTRSRSGPVRVDRHVADLAAVAGDPGERLAVDDHAAADADLAREEQDVVRAEGRAATDLGQGAEIGLVGDVDRDVAAEAPRRAARRAGRRASRGSAPSTRTRRSRRTMPATATPMPITRPPAGRRPGRGPRARRGRRRSRRPRVAARRGRPGSSRGPSPPSPTTAAASESTAISSARTTAPSGFGRTSGDGRPGVPSGVGRSSVDEAGGDQLADQAADRAAGQAGAGDELRARQRPAGVELADDRAEVRPANGLAALTDLVATHRHRVCVPLVQMCCATVSHRPLTCQAASMRERRRRRRMGGRTAR